MVGKVYISAGHHAKDPGAVSNGFIERDEVAKLRNAIVSKLKCKKQPYVTDDDSENNSQYQGRIRKTLTDKDIVIDLHLDAASPKATGFTIFVSKYAGKRSIALAKEAEIGLAKITGLNSRGVRSEEQSQHKRIGILNLKGSAILIELGFITNENDMKIFHEKFDEITDFISDLAAKFANI